MLTLCLDFDGVLHGYQSGWKGAHTVNDPPVPGALEFLEQATKHFQVCIYSSRSHQEGGLEAMQDWLKTHIGHPLPDWYYDIGWPTHKPAAFVTIDDRAITFDGAWPSMETIKAFKPWNKRT